MKTSTLNSASASPGLARREFLTAVVASLFVTPGCLREKRQAPLKDDTSASAVRLPSDPSLPMSPSEVVFYESVLVSYFGRGGLASASFIGSFYLRNGASLSGSEGGALSQTRAVRALMAEAGSVVPVREGLERRLQSDFEAMRVVDVGGWTLGRTEVELCVLASLVSAG